MEILRIEHVYKEYGDKNNKVLALNDVNLSVNKGEFVAIVGFSGSGNPPDAGRESVFRET